ncbi:hypothetical protein PJE062_165 [Pseudovibrio sp. JE062]|nr:hypothetical protein PJE062_165 [Pseudovibrio sp. JE062]
MLKSAETSEIFGSPAVSSDARANTLAQLLNFLSGTEA